ncbi:MAG: signal peptide peptidase SppA [Flavobacteriaceae bacterium]|nr:signal peptide peptidase SppA [Flavobacteriaceae bacterium]
MTFLRELLAVILGIFISLFIMFAVFAIAVSTLSSSFSSEEIVEVKDNSILTLKLEEAIKDYAPKSDDPFAMIFDFKDEKIGLNVMINAIENAKTDDRIKGISIEAMDINAGISQLQSLRNKLQEFKETGKFVYAFADMYTQRNYYLSSVADSLFVNPVGGVDFKGLSSEMYYFKDFQDKYGVKMEVIRHGKYKSAVEPFLSNTMSAENREQTASFLNSIWGELINDIGFSKNKSNEELNKIADSLFARNPELAVANGMVHASVYKDQYRNKLKGLVGVENLDDVNYLTLSDYISSGKGRIKSSAKDRIAVIYAQGEIIYGEGDEETIGQDLIISALKKARKNPHVKAVVLRINSPGGSGLASDIMWRELEITGEQLPLVVSMGDVAASGGYYMACNADKIFAEPTTITGSIGVFGILPNISELAGRIGINAEQVGTNHQSTGYSLFEPISSKFYNNVQMDIEDFYKTFVQKVADGRKMTFAQVDSVAQGRVWTGKQAKDIGLVDELGSLEDAIAAAADLADLTEYQVRNYPDYDMTLKNMFKGSSFISSKKEAVIKAELGQDNYKMYKNMKQISEWQGIQARIPFIFEIK